MGTYIHLAVGRLQIDWGKNSGYTDHACLFQPSDLTQIPYYYVDDDKGDYVDDEGKTRYHHKVIYKDGMSKPLRQVADRLALLGFSLEVCQREFDKLFDGLEPDEEILSFEDLKQAFIALDVNQMMHDPEKDYMQFDEFLNRSLSSRLDCTEISLGPYTVLVLLALNPDAQNLPVEWQFFDSEESGWIERWEVIRQLDPEYRFLIVTEGSSDAHIIRHALKLLHPHIADFFEFVDMEEGYPFSGTGNLLKFLKGLISISIRNDVLVLYDNDLEGVTNYEKSCALNAPANMVILKLPDREEFERFPTIGPNGEHTADINGSAAAIECFLDTGPEARVRWTSYNDRIEKYQGELESKTAYAKAFLSQRKLDSGYDYSGIEYVLTSVIIGCIEIQRKKEVRRSVADL